MVRTLNRQLLPIAALALLGVLVVTPAQAGGPKKSDAPTILVKFVKGSGNRDDLVGQEGDQAIGATKTGTVIVRVRPGASVEQTLAEYRQRADVVYAEVNGTMSAAGIGQPTDPSFGSQWGLAAVDAIDAWGVFPGSYTAPAGPTIAIVDSGVDSTHPDLAGKVLTASGANCVSGTCVGDPAMDDYGHGTHVAGIAAAQTNNGVGIAGLAFDAPILPVKVLDSNGNGNYASVTSGIIWAADHRAAVINLSLGSTAYSQTVCDAVAYAINAGAVVVAAAGNNGTSTFYYPAACPGTIGVAATDSTDTRASFSETGYPNVFLSAPGVNILSDYPGGSYASESGTSMAAPFVSAVAELILGESPTRTVSDVKRLLAGSANKVGSVSYGADPYATCAGCSWNSSYGYGRLNAYRALTIAEPAPAPDFALATSAATLNVQRGTSGKVTVSTTTSTGFASPVSLSLTGLPSGASASLSPASITGVGSSTLTVTVPASTAYGSYPLTIGGTSGALVHTSPLTLVVPGPDFTLNLSSASASVIQGGKPTSTISLSNLNGFTGTAALTVSGAPAGTTAVFSPTSISGTKTSALTITTTTSTAPGTYQLTVTGTSGSLTHTAVYTLTVALAVPDFSVAVTPASSNIPHGHVSSIAYTVTITPVNGFKGTVSFSAAGIPTGTTGAWKASTAAITSATAVTGSYTLTIPSTATKSASTITFTVTGGGLTHTATAAVTVT